MVINDDLVSQKGRIKYASISMSEILSGKGARFDASVYCTDGRMHRLALESLRSKYLLENLSPGGGVIKSCSYPGRFKRIYVKKHIGVEFLLPSQMTDVYPKAEKFISPKTQVNIAQLKARSGEVLLTRSGTIGNLTYVSETLKDKVFSDDVIRISFNKAIDGPYVYAFLKSKTGQSILTTNNYGAVVQHIEPSHLSEILFPYPSEDQRAKIANNVLRSFSFRDESNKLIKDAQKELIEQLKLPPIEQLFESTLDKQCHVQAFSVGIGGLGNRFDGSFHTPLVDMILLYLTRNCPTVTHLHDTEYIKAIKLAGRFKRVYVNSENGIPFFGGKQIGELVPSNPKYLSKVHHQKRADEELLLRQNMILVTCSGTIGKVSLVPKHLEGWAANQHIMRIVANKYPGYLFAWLDSDYGQILIKKHTYGAVVDEIDDRQLSRVELPIINKEYMENINSMVLKANELRYEAYISEKNAIDEMDMFLS